MILIVVFFVDCYSASTSIPGEIPYHCRITPGFGEGNDAYIFQVSSFTGFIDETKTLTTLDLGLDLGLDLAEG